MTTATKKGWKRLRYMLPPREATDCEHAYISQQVLIKSEHEDFIGADLLMAVLFIGWDGDITMSAGNWFEQHTFKPNDDYFYDIFWKEIE